MAALVVLGIGTSLATLRRGPRHAARAAGRCGLPSPGELLAEGGSLLRTGRWLWLASMFAMLTANAEVLLLNRQADLPLVGAYALALNLANKADLVNSSLYTVLLPGVATLRERHARRRLRAPRLAARRPDRRRPAGADPAGRAADHAGLRRRVRPAAVFFRLLIGVMVFDVLLTPLLLLPLAYRQPRLLAAADALRAITLVLVALGADPDLRRLGAIVARFAARVAGAVLVLGALWLGRARRSRSSTKKRPGVAAVAASRPAARRAIPAR